MKSSLKFNNIQALKIIGVTLVCVAMGASLLALKQLGTESKTSTEPKTEPKYLIFWASEDKVLALAKKVGDESHGKERMIGIGVPCAAFAEEDKAPTIIHNAFTFAKKNDLAVMLHFDFHVFWPNRTDLWNWFDPSKPGYNLKNKNNVEWFGWKGPASKARYINWGEAQKMPPQLCYTSKEIRAEWKRIIQNVIVPNIKKETAELKSEGKSYLFAGVLIGSEPTFDNYKKTDPDTAKLIAEDGAPAGELGYRSLLDRGYSKDHQPTNIHKALGEVIEETISFWCKTFVDAGIPASKLYPHIPAGADIETTNAPIKATFNSYSRPGWSTYPVGPLQKSFQPLYDELKKHGNPPWGGVEANVGFPGTIVDWETYLGWHFNHGAMLMGINIGATGKELPDALERSSFGDEAINAYRKFLKGETLIEKTPTVADSRASMEASQLKLRERMEILQAGFKKWQKEGRDPSPVAQYVQDRMPALLQAGKIEEAIDLVNEAIKKLGLKENGN